MSNEVRSHRLWTSRLLAYRGQQNWRGGVELAITLLAFFAFWFAALALAGWSWFASVPFIVVAGAFLVRVFIVQHDCGHQALFSSARWNDRVGRLLGVLTFTPYDDWRRAHAIHHAASGNLDRRGEGDIDTLTVREYRAMRGLKRFGYRLYRHPFTLFVLGPMWQFLLRQRFPTCEMKTWMPLWSTSTTNLGIVVVSAAIWYAFGWQALLFVHLPIVVVAGAIGMWLFFVQHQFENTHWSGDEEWQRENAALHGSSFYDLPRPLMWLFGNIGIHHVHHISSQIPFYRLPKVLKDFPELKTIGRLKFIESFSCAKLALWCEEQGRLVSFRQAKLAPAV